MKESFLNTSLIVLVICSLLTITIVAAEEEKEAKVELSVHVKDKKSGDPIAGALVSVSSQPDYRTNKKTATEGRAFFSDIPKGRVRIQVTAKRYETFGDDYNIVKSINYLDIELIEK